jgi:uncharacterized protein YbaP (TraB family)
MAAAYVKNIEPPMIRYWMRVEATASKRMDSKSVLEGKLAESVDKT